MRKQLFFAVLALAGWLFPQVIEAQFIGYVSPQTTQQTLASSVACTGGNQFFNINNLGQTQHYLQVSGTAGTTSLSAQLQGIDAQGNSYPISDVLFVPSGALGLSVRGSGYWPQIRASIVCSPSSGSFTVNYSGAWATTDVNAGTYLTAQLEKPLFNFASEAATQGVTFSTPFGSTAGQIIFEYSAIGAGGTLAVTCASASGTFILPVETYALASITTFQTFQVPDNSCTAVNVQYNTNSSAGGVTIDYIFAQPGNGLRSQQYAHITNTTATAVKATAGYLHTLTINTGAAGTISFFDLTSASCTGTPSTNTVAVATATTSSLQTLTYDVNFLTGICVKASAAMDLTVSYQ